MGSFLAKVYEVETELVRHPRLDQVRSQFGKLFPSYLLDGPYHMNTKIGLTLLYGGLLYSGYQLMRKPGATNLTQGRTDLLGPTSSLLLRFAGMCYGWSVLVYMFKEVGYFPLASYTMISWTLTTLRYTFGVMSKAFPSMTMFQSLDEGLRFPALAQNSVTFAIWWLVLVPVLTASLPAGDARNRFHEWNTSFFLLTVHGLNLPFAVLDHVIAPRKLKYFDLWIGMSMALAYLAFYLRFLDRHGIHLYIILSPRTAFSPLVMGGMLGGYFGFWKGYSRLADLVLQSYKSK